ncbi:MAG: PQQ-binding-like beta-propeller repeat protein [Planctomycetaceae bacterium]|nr:PQQ-binding-like beta-propeller repeat protein [Planctomycetaceae bacterium]
MTHKNIAFILMTISTAALFSPTAAQDSSPAGADWLMFNGTYSADRYSPLKQITTQNVNSIEQVGFCQLPETTSFQSGPVVVDNKLFVTTATATYALDAKTAKLLWTQKYEPKSMGIGTPVRGVAYADGKLYRGTPDAHLLALDANTGKVLWDVEGANAQVGEYYTAAPIVWQGSIFIGTSGSDVGAIGRMRAFSTKDGQRLWNFDIVPSEGQGADSWPSDPAKHRAGGGMYSSFALDTETGTLYVPTGNPGPDFAPDYRAGDNLFTCSVIMLDAKTGKLLGYHQFVPNDFHDWDIAASPILFTSKAGRKMVAVGGKNGYLYGLDRRLSEVLWQTPVTTISNAEAPLTPEGTRFLPGTQGGVNWNGPAYSPLTNGLYVNTRDWGTTVKMGGPEELQYTPGKNFLGSSNEYGEDDPASEQSGWLTAADADDGRVLWKYHAAKPLTAAVTPTAGGLVFTGDLEGNMLAFDAKTGDILAKKQTSGPIGGGIVTYLIDGKQYVAVAAGMKNGLMKVSSGPAAVVLYSLPEQKTAP